MGLFGSPKTNSLIGIDLSSSSVKLIELQNDKTGSKLLTYGYAEFPFAVGERDPLDDLKGTSALLKKLASESGAKTKQAIAGIPMSKVFSSIITVPMLPDKDLALYVQQQAQKLVSSPIAEMQLDWKIIDRAEAEQAKRKSLRALVTGTRKAQVQKYVDIFQLAGLELMSLEPDIFALIRSLIGKDPETTMMVDFGAARTNIAIIEKGIPTLNRSITIGGSMITTELAKILGVPEKEAEETKRDIQALGAPGQSGLPTSVERIIQPILHDIEYLFKEYNEGQMGNGQMMIEKIVFTGGSASLPNLAEYIRNRLNVNAYVGDPFSRIAFPADLAPVVDEIGPRLAVAAGLALKET